MQGVVGVEDRTTRTQPAEDGVSRVGSSQDSALANQIAIALGQQRQEDLSDVQVRVEQGVAHLSGTTRNIAGKALAEQVARTVPGVTSVVNEVMPDSTIRARVEAALAEDPRTALVPIDVIVQSGVVTLLGRVPSIDVEKAAEQIARSTPGVKIVVNQMDMWPELNDTLDARPVAIRMPS
jgi:osmotically-inducible protein OsmY